MAHKRDYYEVLGVARDADKDAIKRAYRKLALQFHPDKNKGHDAEEKFKELSEAYAVLSDEQKRGLYDRFGHAGVSQRYSPEDIFRGADFGDIFGNLGSIFESFFGTGQFGFKAEGGRGPEGGRDLLARVTVSLEEAFEGSKHELQVEREAPCKECDGSGAAKGSELHRCSECGGRGQLSRAQRTVFGSFVQVVTCGACEGSGTRVDKPCKSCEGRGRNRVRQTIEVRIPPGIDDGDRLRLGGQGEVAARGGEAGDLFVEVHVRPHARFARHGSDLLAALPVDYATLVLGGTLSLDTLDGELEYEVPAGSKPGQRLRLKGRGMTSTRGGRGDLYLQLDLRVPEKPSKRERELLEELRTTAHEENGGWFRRREKSK